MNYYIVIGSGHGDEGKGLMTDYLSSKHEIKRVIRFNGGCQAGHTVQVGNHRQVFSNWSSGTLAGAITELNNNVILNPYHALHELDSFSHKVEKIDIPLNPIITTPIDVRFNQLIEQQRGNNRHGSCGLGINETVTRHNDMLVSGECYDITQEKSLKWLADVWVSKRAKQLELEKISVENIMDSRQTLIENFQNVWEAAKKDVYQIRQFPQTENLVYEGAQGLGLDETLGDFPFVTRSNTGIRNALVDIKHRIEETCDTKPNVFIYYMTRIYSTRHGVGPLNKESTPFEITGQEFGKGKFSDLTNQPNPWQGSLRFAPLDLDLMQQRIDKDLQRNKNLLSEINYNVSVCVTCMDQTDSVKVISNSNLLHIDVINLPTLIEKSGLNVSHLSYGPTAKDVLCLK